MLLNSSDSDMPNKFHNLYTSHPVLTRTIIAV